jgi:AsmA-like C-terminal region
VNHAIFFEARKRQHARVNQICAALQQQVGKNSSGGGGQYAVTAEAVGQEEAGGAGGLASAMRKDETRLDMTRQRAALVVGGSASYLVLPASVMRLAHVLKSKWLLIGGGVIVLLALAVLVFLAPKWPFREAEMRKRLEHATNAKVEFGSFRQQFLPHPGCVMERVTLTPSDPKHPKVTIQKLTVDGLYRGLIGKEKHIRALLLDGLQIAFPPKSASDEDKPDNKPEKRKPQRAQAPGMKFDQIEARNSQIVLAPTGKDKEPRTFDIYDVILKSFAPGEAIHFNAVLKVPEPKADVDVEGLFGPLTGEEIGKAKLKGRFRMKNGDLSKFHSLIGTISAQGDFDGTLADLTVHGTTDSPDFGARDTQHALPLKTQFTAVVDGTSGDVRFQPIDGILGQTKLAANGQLAPAADGHGKTLTLEITSDDARIQDLMYLFVRSKPPLQGPTRFQMKVELPPDKKPFEERVQMTAHFGIHDSKFTHSNTENKVSELSEKAKGNPKDQDPPMVATNLTGDVKLEDGMAHFSRFALRVPGADAVLHGTYNLVNHAVDLHGTLHTSVKLSNATTGFKAFLMKVIEFGKQKDKGPATVPVHITGTYDKPDFGVDAAAEK